MAILAMEQTAYLLCALEPRLRRLVDAGARQSPKAPRRAEVWFPAASLLGDETIPRSWDVTSDSLAAILARRLRAQGLLLVKSAPLDGIRCGVLELQAAGLVDGAFDRFGADCGCPVWLLGRESSANLSRLWQGQGDAALAVEFASAQGPC